MFSGLYSKLFGPTLLTQHTTTIRCLAISPDGSLVASGSGEPAYKKRAAADCSLRITDCKTRLLVYSQEFEAPIECLAFSADGHHLAVGLDSFEEKTVVWLDIRAGKIIRRFGPKRPTVICSTPDGRGLLIGGLIGSDGDVSVWDPETGSQLRQYETLKDMEQPKLSGDGTRIGGIARKGSGGILNYAVCVADATTGNMIAKWPVELQTKYTACKDFSPDGRHVLAAGGEWVQYDMSDNPSPPVLSEHFAVISVASGKCVQNLTTGGVVTRAVFSPDGQYILYTNERNVELIEWKTGRVVKRFKKPISSVSKLLFTPDGRSALFGAYGGSVWLSKV